MRRGAYVIQKYVRAGPPTSWRRGSSPAAASGESRHGYLALSQAQGKRRTTGCPARPQAWGGPPDGFSTCCGSGTGGSRASRHPADRGQPGGVRGRLECRHRHDRVLHRIQDQVPVPGRRRDRDPRDPGGAGTEGVHPTAGLYFIGLVQRSARSCDRRAAVQWVADLLARAGARRTPSYVAGDRARAARDMAQALRGLQPGTPSRWTSSPTCACRGASAARHRGRVPGAAQGAAASWPPLDAPTERLKEERRAGDHDDQQAPGEAAANAQPGGGHRGHEPCHRRKRAMRRLSIADVEGSSRGARRPAGLGGPGLRGPSARPQASPEVDARQRRPDRPHHRLRDRQGLREDAALAEVGWRRGRVRLLGQAGAGVPGRREAPPLGTLGAGAQARAPLRAGRRRGDRPATTC